MDTYSNPMTRLEPESLDIFLEDFTDRRELIEQLWLLRSYTDTLNPGFTLLTYEQWCGFIDKYLRQEDDMR